MPSAPNSSASSPALPSPLPRRNGFHGILPAKLTLSTRTNKSHAANVATVSYQPTILDLPPCERPRERLREHGPRYLNNAELVAILLRSGVAGENAINVAMRILAEFDGACRAGPGRIRGALRAARAQPRQIQRDHGSLGAWSPHRFTCPRGTLPDILSAGRGQPAHRGDGAPGAGEPGCPAAQHP